MADLQINSKNGRSKAAPRIDLTPMVDLGFLLITFFIMTTSMRKPKAMDIQMPYKPATKDTTAFYESSAITLLPAKDHRIFYYEGCYTPSVQLKVVNDVEVLRSVLTAKQKALRNRPNLEERNVQVLIKPHETAAFTDIVSLFDEMNICGVKYYAMVDIYPEENKLIEEKIR